MEKYCEDNRYMDGGYQDNDYQDSYYGDGGCDGGCDSGCSEKKRCYEVIERKCPEQPKPQPKPKPKPFKPCGCGSNKFVEPRMKRTNCMPCNCRPRNNVCACCTCCND